jgi:hypothetical protein
MRIPFEENRERKAAKINPGFILSWYSGIKMEGFA